MITCHFIIAYNARLNNLGNVKNRERILQPFAMHQASLCQTVNIVFCNTSVSLSSDIVNFFPSFRPKIRAKLYKLLYSYGKPAPK